MLVDKLAVDLRFVETLLKSIDLGIVVTDLSGEVLLFNNAATTILGVGGDRTPPEEWPRRYGIYSADGTTLCSAAQSPLLRAINGEEADNVQAFIVKPRSRNAGLWCSINLRPLKNGNDDIEGAVLVVQDITERKKLADEVERSNAALQQFASVAAHDLQEPLRSVTGFVDLLAQHLGDSLDEKSTHYMTRTKVAVSRMRMLISDLLDYSRIQAQAPVLRAVNCNQLLERCVEGLAGSILEKQATVQWSELPTLLADPSQLLQLFQNLIGNAIKFAAVDRPPVISISAKKIDLHWQFAIEDNGIGMDMQFAQRVFVLFQRLHPAAKYSGTGIGLAICKKIVDHHGGRIWVESEPGRGSVFCFTILSPESAEDTQ